LQKQSSIIRPYWCRDAVTYTALSMKNRGIIEDIIGITTKNPIIGLVLSIFFAGLGFYLTGKQAPVSTNSTGTAFLQTAFLPMLQFIGKICYIFSAVILICTLIGFIVATIKRKDQISFYEQRRTLDDLKKLSWKEFEDFIASIFVKLGYSVEVTGRSNDGGIDVVVKKDSRTSLVQCKNYKSSKVTLSMVRDFYGAMNANLNFEAGYFITTGIFTLEAKHFAEDKPIELIDGSRLMEYVNMAESKQTSQPRPDSKKTTAATAVPICPKCGADMILRTAKKGDNAGSQFWGCSAFPKCSATKSIRS